MVFPSQQHHLGQRLFLWGTLLALTAVALLGTALPARAQEIGIGGGTGVWQNPPPNESSRSTPFSSSIALMASRVFIPYFPYDPGDGRKATIHITNGSGLDAVFTLAYFNEMGSQMGSTINGAIGPGGSVVIDESSQLLACRCAVAIGSNQSLAAVVRIEELQGNKISLGLYSGSSVFGRGFDYAPFYSISDGPQTELGLMNISLSSTSFNLTFFNLDGTLAGSYVTGIARPQTTVWVTPDDLIGDVVLSNGIGRVHIVSSNLSTGVAIHSGIDDGFVIDEIFDTSSGLDLMVPRGYNNDTRGSRLYIGNTGGSPVAAQTRLFSTGATVITDTNIPANSVHVIEIGELSDIGKTTHAISVTGDSTLAVWEQSYYVPGAVVRAIGSYMPRSYDKARLPQRVVLPRIVRSSDGYSLISVQNAGSSTANVTMHYRTVAGNSVGTDSVTIMPGHAYHVSTADLGQLIPSEFSGSVIVDSSQPIAVVVDEVGPSNLNSVFLPLVEE